MINPISTFSPEVCALTTLMYFAAGWLLGVEEYRTFAEKTDRILSEAEIFIGIFCYAIRGAALFIIACWAGLFLTAWLTTQIELHIIWDLCANQPISCVNVNRVL